MYSAIAIANHFIRLSAQEGRRDLTPDKLHALVYFAHGWQLGILNRPLITGHILAWRDGVFVPELKDIACWGDKIMQSPLSIYQLDEARGMMTEQTPELPAGDPIRTSLDWIWKGHGRLGAWQLNNAIKEVGAPWDLIWNDEERTDDEPRRIPNATMRLWFRNLTEKRRRERHLQQTGTFERREGMLGLEDTQPVLEAPNPHRLRAT